MTTTEAVLEDGFYLPNLAVCSKTHYKHSDLHMFNIDEYKNNTYDPRTYIDRVQDVEDWDGTPSGTLNWTETEIFTYKYGRCMLYEFQSKV